jgi:hypothetical protein
MALRLNGSTSGYVELDAPAVAGTTALTLPLGGFGKVLQVVNATYSTQTSSSTDTYADTGLTASITPSSVSSNVLVIVNQAGCMKETNNTYLRLRLLRGATGIADFEQYGGFTGSVDTSSFGACSVTILDSPSTTSATTYKTQMMSNNNNAAVYVQTNSSVSSITLVEIAA